MRVVAVVGLALVLLLALLDHACTPWSGILAVQLLCKGLWLAIVAVPAVLPLVIPRTWLVRQR